MYKCQGRGSTDWLDSCPSSSRIVCSRNSIFSMTRKNSAECVVFVCWRDCWWTGSAVLDSVMHATYTIQWTDTSTFFSFYSPKCKLSDTRKFRLEEMTVPCTVGRMHVVKRPLVLTSNCTDKQTGGAGTVTSSDTILRSIITRNCAWGLSSIVPCMCTARSRGERREGVPRCHVRSWVSTPCITCTSYYLAASHSSHVTHCEQLSSVFHLLVLYQENRSTGSYWGGVLWLTGADTWAVEKLQWLHVRIRQTEQRY